MKGIVTPKEVRRTCATIRELLSVRENVVDEVDWDRLQEYTKLQRCFTVAEVNRVADIYTVFRHLKFLKANRAKRERK